MSKQNKITDQEKILKDNKAKRQKFIVFEHILLKEMSEESRNNLIALLEDGYEIIQGFSLDVSVLMILKDTKPKK